MPKMKKATPKSDFFIECLEKNLIFLSGNQFEILGLMSGAKDNTLVNGNDGRAKFYINNKGVYARICIKKVSYYDNNVELIEDDKNNKKENKKFLIIGNMNAITYKEIFPYIKNNELWLGNRGLGKDFFFGITDEYKDEIVKSKTQGGGWKVIDGEIMGRVANACWFTNIPHNKRNQPLDLYRKYNPTDYPKYDNYLAFNVDKVAEIPEDEYIDIEIDEKDYLKWKAAYGDDVEILEN